MYDQWLDRGFHFGGTASGERRPVGAGRGIGTSSDWATHPRRIPGSIFAMAEDVHFWEIREEMAGGRKYSTQSTQDYSATFAFIYWTHGSQYSRIIIRYYIFL